MAKAFSREFGRSLLSCAKGGIGLDHATAWAIVSSNHMLMPGDGGRRTPALTVSQSPDWWPGPQLTFPLDNTAFASHLCNCRMDKGGWASTPPWALAPRTRGLLTTVPSFSSAQAGQPDGHHHHGCVNATILICDIRPAVLCLWPAVASEAERCLRGASSLEEPATGLPGTGCMSGVATTMAATGTQCGSSALVQPWLKDCDKQQRTWENISFSSLNTNSWT